ncbi:Hypothetical predicted protein [Olea europaea subsp. europaea]|uniref:histone deacetylase n=1 Tax=Olea europaea subsp. europaea TaxID=158383 RepID=A0A8S0U8U8_OLEEU|nr:Hypothetical predicted protein [Olea europaea subsp. europaea]
MKLHPHPERPNRLRAIAASLATAGIFPERCYPILAREIKPEELQMVHSSENIEAVEPTSHILSSYLTPDTYANQHSTRAARLAAGLCADLASAIYSGSAKNGFALVCGPTWAWPVLLEWSSPRAKLARAFFGMSHWRPEPTSRNSIPTLHTGVFPREKLTKCCTRNNHLRENSVLYISLHRYEGGKFYPGTGAADEVGTMGAEGYCVYVPWSRGGVGDNDYVFAFQQAVLPIDGPASAGALSYANTDTAFNVAEARACSDVTPAGYAQMTEMCSVLSGGKLLVILEGRYNLRSISSSATAVIKKNRKEKEHEQQCHHGGNWDQGGYCTGSCASSIVYN